MEMIVFRVLRWIPMIIEYGVVFLGLGIYFFSNCFKYTNDFILKVKGETDKSAIKSLIFIGVNAGLTFLVAINIYNFVRHFF